MYKIYADKLLIHNDNYDKLKLNDPELELELNQVGSLKFSIYPNHPYYNNFTNSNSLERIKKMKSIVRVERNGKLLFRGRILESEDGFYKEKQVICEGELAFFIDSQLRPYSITGTPENIFKFYVDTHNAQMKNYPEKQFVVGRVTVTDGELNDENTETRSSESIVSVWNEISGLIESLGGYLIVDDDEDGNRRVNWLTEDDFLFGTQSIDFGKNLLNIKINAKGDEIATALIPVGGEISSSTDEEGTEIKKRLDITEENDTDEPVLVAELEDDKIYRVHDYIYSEKGVEEYGLIFTTNTWDDIKEDKSHLLSVAVEQLSELSRIIESIEINAFDLSKINDNISSFQLGTKIKVTSKIHGLNGESFPIAKISLNLSNPSSDTLTLARIEKTFTETSVSANKVGIGAVAEKVDKVENEIIETTQQLSSEITQSTQQIYSKVSEDYFTKDEAEVLVQSVNTELEQTKDSFEMRFNEIQAEANDHYQEQVKYIRFKDGNILLGEEGNELTLKISNDRISFLQDGIEVAYFSNRKLYVLDGEFINSLKLGKFAFIPRSTGNLSFKKVE